ncbi:ATP-binding protein [Allochromatium humboldtianum]|uniref:ATP-binding protein n=1 Tax=Allochromatium humboldtianum TaxID=504901 RepID=A0A850R6H8_9GAMM|nr:ATP-binding protein [Allochromatium humboldtianum]NVZ08928.1 ATP-binding protein [Allochromatium humboldtianum]
MTAPAPARPRKLPIGLQNLREIITDGYCYVDKTMHALALAEAGKYYFLSRPRRFGKSLFLDTLKELFEGNEPLFRGLYVHDRWDWSQRHPVIRLDFSAGILESREELDRHIRYLLRDNARRLGLACDPERDGIPGAFSDLIRGAQAQSGQSLVILVDEYDKPILDNIDHPKRAAEAREGLKNLYSAMKGRDAELRFVFMTGVTKFSKVSLFSGINQLQDLTLDPRCATLCGYTQHDLETVFAEHLAGVDWEQLRRWYNGYGFLGDPVYNPFDILLFISKGRTYRNYWFETGSPSFLIKLFQRRRYFLPDLEAVETSEEILDSFDIERIDPVTLLFQTGYLTIDQVEQRFGQLLFRLRIPNQEVRLALMNHLVDAWTDRLPSERMPWQLAIHEPLIHGDVAGLIAAIKRLFAGIPWRNFTYSDLPEYEGYYASVLYAFFVSLNAEVIAEDISHHGQVDLTVKLEGYVYVIEIKVERGRPVPTPDQEPVDNPALAQIRARGYSAKYRGLPARGLFEVGLVFDPDARNLIQGDWVAV